MEGPARSAWQLYLGPCGIRTRCPRSPCLEAALVQPPAESRSSPPTEARVREKWLEELSRQRERYQRTGQRGRCERSDEEQTDFFQSSTVGTNIMFFVWRSNGPSNFVGRVWLTVVVVACHLTSQCQVLLPDFTMVAVANVVKMCGAKPTVCDNAAGSVIPGAHQYVEKATPGVKAAVVCHTCGIATNSSNGRDRLAVPMISAAACSASSFG